MSKSKAKDNSGENTPNTEVKPIKCISTYADEYANTSIGSIIATCKVIKNEYGSVEYHVIAPKGVRERYSSSYCNWVPLPEHMIEKYPVGYYTSGSHFKIMKEAGFADYIKSQDFWTKQSENPDCDSRTTSWYINMGKLKEGMSETQTELYHM